MISTRHSLVAAALCALLCAREFPGGFALAGDWPFAPTLNTQTMAGGTDLKTGGTDVIAVGVHDNGSAGPIRSFHQFDLSALPSTVTVSTVTFRFRTQLNQGTLPTTLRIVQLETTNAMDVTVNWTRLNTSTNWTTGGGNIGQLLATLTPVWSNSAEYVFSSSNAFVMAVQDAIANRNGLFQILVYSPDHEAAHPIPQTTGGFIRMYARNTAFPAALTVGLSVDPPGAGTNAAPWFGVDYNDATHVQGGFSNGGSVTSGSISNTTANAFRDGRTFTSILTATSANMQERVRQDIGSTTSNALLRDLVFASSGDLLLTLRGLMDNPYQFTAWFNDSGSGTPNGLDGNYEASIDSQILDTWQATYTLDASTGIGTCDFIFPGHADADTVIDIVNTTVGKHAMINGFRLIKLPKTATGTVIMLF